VIDPSYAPAFSYAAYWHCYRIGQEWSPDLAMDFAEAARLSIAAIDRDGSDAMALAIHGHVQSIVMKDFDAALRSFDRALAVCPNSAVAWTFSGATYCFTGDGPRAVARAEAGLRLSPTDLHVFFAEHILSQAHYINGNFDQAVLWAQRADQRNRRLTSNLRTLTASLVAIGRLDEAREVARRHMEIVPTFSVSAWAARTPMQDTIRKGRVARLLLAGMPD